MLVLFLGACVVCPDLWSQNLDRAATASQGQFAPLLADSSSKKPVPVWFYAVMGLGIAAFVWWLVQSDKKRTEKVIAIVASLGWTYRKEATAADQALIADSHLATQGRNRKIFNVIELPAADRSSLFDFQYWLGPNSQNSTTAVMTIARFQSDKLLTVPPFVLRPENIGDKVMAAVGWQDINFPEHPVFSKKYLLHSQDEAAVRQFFTPRIITFFEQDPGWFVEVSGDRLYAYREGHIPKPEEISGFFENRRKVLEALV